MMGLSKLRGHEWIDVNVSLRCSAEIIARTFSCFFFFHPIEIAINSIGKYVLVVLHRQWPSWVRGYPSVVGSRFTRGPTPKPRTRSGTTASESRTRTVSWSTRCSRSCSAENAVSALFITWMNNFWIPDTFYIYTYMMEREDACWTWGDTYSKKKSVGEWSHVKTRSGKQLKANIPLFHERAPNLINRIAVRFFASCLPACRARNELNHWNPFEWMFLRYESCYYENGSLFDAGSRRTILTRNAF